MSSRKSALTSTTASALTLAATLVAGCEGGDYPQYTGTYKLQGKATYSDDSVIGPEVLPQEIKIQHRFNYDGNNYTEAATITAVAPEKQTRPAQATGSFYVNWRNMTRNKPEFYPNPEIPGAQIRSIQGSAPVAGCHINYFLMLYSDPSKMIPSADHVTNAYPERVPLYADKAANQTNLGFEELRSLNKEEQEAMTADPDALEKWNNALAENGGVTLPMKFYLATESELYGCANYDTWIVEEYKEGEMNATYFADSVEQSEAPRVTDAFAGMMDSVTLHAYQFWLQVYAAIPQLPTATPWSQDEDLANPTEHNTLMDRMAKGAQSFSKESVQITSQIATARAQELAVIDQPKFREVLKKIGAANACVASGTPGERDCPEVLVQAGGEMLLVVTHVENGQLVTDSIEPTQAAKGSFVAVGPGMGMAVKSPRGTKISALGVMTDVQGFPYNERLGASRHSKLAHLLHAVEAVAATR